MFVIAEARLIFFDNGPVNGSHLRAAAIDRFLYFRSFVDEVRAVPFKRSPFREITDTYVTFSTDVPFSRIFVPNGTLVYLYMHIMKIFL